MTALAWLTLGGSAVFLADSVRVWLKPTERRVRDVGHVPERRDIGIRFPIACWWDDVRVAA